MKQIGIEPGKSFDIGRLDPVVQRALETAPQDAQKLMAWKLPTLARVANGWAMNTDTMGVYGNYYLKRAIVAQLVWARICPRTPSIRSISPTIPASRSTAPTNTPSRSRRAPRLRSTRSGRSRSTIRTDSRSATPSTASPSVAGCRSSTTPTVRSTSISRRQPRQGPSQLASRAERPLQSDDAPLRAEVGALPANGIRRRS